MLLDALHRAGTLERYVPVDVTENMVRDCANELIEEYPGLRVHGVVGDFERHLDRVPPAAGPRLVVFLGGTIGNFPPGSRRRFLREIADLLGPRDHLLMGTDLVKDADVLEAAYDDAQGVTAEFNRNVLHVLNRELDADFEPHDFDHIALFDDRHEWIEMRLRARHAHTVTVRALELDVHFDVRRGAAHRDLRQVHPCLCLREGPRRRGPGAGALARRPRGPVRIDALAAAGVRGPRRHQAQCLTQGPQREL